MKVFSQVGQKNLDQVKPENINNNTRKVVGEYNGKLDGQNVPVDSIDKLKLKPSSVNNNFAPNVHGFDFIGQTQNYHFIRRWKVLDSGSDIHTPLVNFDLHNNSWFSGWNNLTEIDSTFNNFALEFEAESGVLSGCFDVNFRHGTDRLKRREDDLDFFESWSFDWWSRWGLFCNDVLIAETSRIYPRLINVSIPYKIFVGSQPVRLELKWQTIDTAPTASFSTQFDQVKSSMEIYGAAIWACNTKR